MFRIVILLSVLFAFIGCGSSSQPVVTDGPRSVLPPDTTDPLTGNEGHPL